MSKYDHERTYSVIVKYNDEANGQAVEMFMDQFSRMFRAEFKEHGSVTVMREYKGVLPNG